MITRMLALAFATLLLMACSTTAATTYTVWDCPAPRTVQACTQGATR